MHCLNTDQDFGRIFQRTKNVFELRYSDNRILNDIGDWFYDQYASDKNMILNAKYQRYLLFKKLCISDKLTVKAKEPIIRRFRAEEKKNQLQTLSNIKRMSTGEIECPEYFFFRRSFSRPC